MSRCRPDRAEPLVFLHGIGTGPESWDAMIDQLSPRFRALAPPLPLLFDESARFTLQDAGQELLVAFNRHGFNRIHLCGLSLGAMAALQLAIDHPERVASLTLAGRSSTHHVD